MLLCRVAGLRQAAIADTPAELGGASFATRAALEMDRLLTLTRRQAQEEQEAVPEHLRRKQGFDLRGNDYSSGTMTAIRTPIAIAVAIAITATVTRAINIAWAP